MKKIFHKMQNMVDNNKDIAVSTTMLGINKVPQGAILKVGVTEDCISKLASNEYMFALVIVNKNQLKEIES
jgi:hypothetical protein